MEKFTLTQIREEKIYISTPSKEEYGKVLDLLSIAGARNQRGSLYSGNKHAKGQYRDDVYGIAYMGGWCFLVDGNDAEYKEDFKVITVDQIIKPKKDEVLEEEKDSEGGFSGFLKDMLESAGGVESKQMVFKTEEEKDKASKVMDIINAKITLAEEGKVIELLEKIEKAVRSVK